MEKTFTNVFLADDDEDDRLFFTDAFSELKINTKVETFENGKNLMDFLHDESSKLPELLFLDLNMPFKNGIECLKEIKANPRLSDITVAVYSTSDSEEHIEETFVLGANVYIKKPNDYEKLKKILQEVVTVNWQYHTSGLNKENFLMKV